MVNMRVDNVGSSPLTITYDDICHHMFTIFALYLLPALIHSYTAIRSFVHGVRMN